MKHLNVNYKILVLAPLFGFVTNSCTHGTKNVFMGANNDTLLLKDVQTGEKRIYIDKYRYLTDILPYFHVGDTVLLASYYGKEKEHNEQYKNKRIFDRDQNFYIAYDHDKIHERKIQEKIKEQKSVIKSVENSINQKQK